MSCLNSYRLAFAVAGSIGALGCGGAVSPDVPSANVSKFVVVGARGTILSSPDGTKWSKETSGVSANLTSVAAGRSTFVAVGTDGTILTSPDAASWTKQSSPTTAHLAHVIFTGEKFIAVGGQWSDKAVTLKSTDGTNWMTVESPSQYSFRAVAYGNGTLVAAAVTPSRQVPMGLDNAVLTSSLSASSSSNGWTQREVPRFTDSLTVGDQILVVGTWGNESTLSSSVDGVTWFSRSVPTSSGNSADAIAFSGSTFVIVGGPPTALLRSTNGTDWTEHPTTLSSGWLSSVTHGATAFVAVGSEGAIITSPDGAVWTKQVGGTASDLTDAAYGPTAP